ncbi:Dyp-type peroxidase [Granulicella sibirica]|uniref:Peroxidase n=1 Tax=Granulicella sibirica TaxID=2479048 RepID=A0A4Q0SWT7_9BACT|nr:Dyp-type peroxidase [Granulicella sibirica]RXH55575.1 Peroxidase [Granulicella sibirica]
MPTVQNPIDPIAIDLDEIQGNILAGFNKDHQRFLFLRIDHVDTAKAWLRALVPQISKSTDVAAFNNDFRAARRRNRGEVNMPKASWINIAFTFAGLKALNASGISSFPGEFKQGMAARKSVIGDLHHSDPNHWQAPFQQPEQLHLVLHLAADDATDLTAATLNVMDGLPTSGLSLLYDQLGETLPAPLTGHEHFGFKDGVSQPGIKGFTASADTNPGPNSGHQGVPGQDLLWPGEFVLGYPTQVPTRPDPSFDGPNPAQGPISASGPAWTRNGSYLVFRKLRQDVAGFIKSVNANATALSMPPEVFGAKIVGRYASGCPIQHTAYEGSDNGFPADFDASTGDPSNLHPEMLDANLINNFEYGDDLRGTGVPRSGHIRKAYPRDEQFLKADGTVDPNSDLHESFTQTHRLLRRGIPFGPAFKRPKHPGDPITDDGVDRGLLFLCYQKSISDQFEFVQKFWINDPNFPQKGDGVDPVMSQSTSGAMKCPFHSKSSTATNTVTLNHFVTTEGGEYFFQPSISALQSLAAE